MSDNSVFGFQHVWRIHHGKKFAWAACVAACQPEERGCKICILCWYHSVTVPWERTVSARPQQLQWMVAVNGRLVWENILVSSWIIKIDAWMRSEELLWTSSEWSGVIKQSLHVFSCLGVFGFLYDRESWTMKMKRKDKNKNKKHSEAFELWCWWRNLDRQKN